MRVPGSIKTVLYIEILLPMLLLVFGVYHGLLQVLYRAGFMKELSFLRIEYYQGLTLHAVINAIVFTTVLIVAFGNLMFLYHLKKPLRPAVQWTGAILMVVGTLMAAWAMFTGKANVLYTFYPPLLAHWSFYLGAALLAVGSLVPFFFDWIPNYISWKRENPDKKVPLAVYGVFINHILWLIMLVPLVIEIFFQLLPLSLGLVSEINPSLARTLFWAFGHPVVYFWLLPAYVMLYTVLPKVVTGEGKLYSDGAARLAFILFLIFSFPVGLHHQYTEPSITDSYKLIHAIFTFGVAVPSFITAFTVASSLEYSIKSKYPEVRDSLFAWWKKIPYASTEGDKWLVSYFMAGLFLFLIGGITGIVNASYNMNNVVHNTAWVPAHFHTTVGGLVTLVFLGMALYFLAQLKGTEVKAKGLAVAAPWLWLVGMVIFNVGYSIAGLMGYPRRTQTGATGSYFDPSSPYYMPDWHFYAVLGAIGGVIATLGFVLYLVSFVSTLFAPAKENAELYIPSAEPYHDEKMPSLQKLTPWVAFSVILFVVSYIPPLYDVTKRGVFFDSPGYNDKSPIPITKPQSARDERKETAEAK
ncbi:cbb3-type cytochrome c oxidase subunit I [Hydrogenobacter sp. T-2]|uniref:cbb3-type cytochrome c oxidase subunit I n=1 Tax=Pampinifervens diazotrophicum TaxID=1632018 RepID=UPI002B262EC6|nr:cbb3-type cytochrome c oxidase subunit I [Hydrogenobacter sp. T-2]WPM32556.1 cbb3-type cytochrome c oxidase subunit I [Hydrogenobacter sp. T-2]